MPKVYQDKEETHLYGGTARKDSLRIEAIGNVDELNSFIGLAISQTADKEIKEILKDMQRDLLAVGADLATPLSVREKRERIGEKDVKRLEEIIAKLESELSLLTKFILPGGSKEASLLHVCRAICRRAERSVVSLKKQEEINRFAFVYINRLSDLLFTLARIANKRKGVKDEEWS